MIAPSAIHAPPRTRKYIKTFLNGSCGVLMCTLLLTVGYLIGETQRCEVCPLPAAAEKPIGEPKGFSPWASTCLAFHYPTRTWVLLESRPGCYQPSKKLQLVEDLRKERLRYKMCSARLVKAVSEEGDELDGTPIENKLTVEHDVCRRFNAQLIKAFVNETSETHLDGEFNKEPAKNQANVAQNDTLEANLNAERTNEEAKYDSCQLITKLLAAVKKHSFCDFILKASVEHTALSTHAWFHKIY